MKGLPGVIFIPHPSEAAGDAVATCHPDGRLADLRDLGME